MRLLEIFSPRLQPILSQDSNPPGPELLVIKMLTKDLLDSALPIGTPRYIARDSVECRMMPETTRSTIELMEAGGEVGAALLMHDERFEELSRSGASRLAIEELAQESWRLQDMFGGVVRRLEWELGLEDSLDVLPGWNQRFFVFDNSYWTKLVKTPQYWRHQDCLGSTVLHSLIEQIGSCSSGTATQVGSNARTQLLANIASEDFSVAWPKDNYSRTPLHIAAQWNVVDVADALLEAGLDPDHQTCTQRTALHYASSLGYADMCRLLLDYNANINAQTKGGNTALMVALLRPDDMYGMFLADENVDLGVTNCQGDNALHLAVLQGNIAAVQEMIPGYGELVNSQNDAGETALILAAQSEKAKEAAEMVKILLESDEINPKLRDKNGKTALHHAATCGNLEACRLLALRIDGGLLLDWSGRRALVLALQGGHQSIATMLIHIENTLLLESR